jgi:hypothetical protein
VEGVEIVDLQEAEEAEEAEGEEEATAHPILPIPLTLMIPTNLVLRTGVRATLLGTSMETATKVKNS